MRLKVFFTPLVFLVIVVLSIWYIWPTIQEIQIKKKEVESSKNNLKSTLEKKQNVETLKGILDKNKEKEDFILSYLPSSRSEERIVDGLNYLATESGLNLSAISIEEEKVVVQSEQPANSAMAANPTVINNSSSGSASVSQPLVVERPRPVARNVNVNATVSGKYENLKIFFDQVYKMNMFNRVNSLSVLKGKADNAEGEQVNSDVLIINVELIFKYLPLIHEETGSPSSIFSSSSIDFSPYTKLNELMTKIIPALDEGQKGKSNPFLP